MSLPGSPNMPFSPFRPCNELSTVFSYPILSSIVHTFYIENDAETFPLHYSWKVAEKGFKMSFMLNKLTMVNSCVIILEK
jgi:hypothetical protein